MERRYTTTRLHNFRLVRSIFGLHIADTARMALFRSSNSAYNSKALVRALEPLATIEPSAPLEQPLSRLLLAAYRLRCAQL
jgi:hypothetical protein